MSFFLGFLGSFLIYNREGGLEFIFSDKRIVVYGIGGDERGGFFFLHRVRVAIMDRSVLSVFEELVFEE